MPARGDDVQVLLRVEGSEVTIKNPPKASLATAFCCHRYCVSVIRYVYSVLRLPDLYHFLKITSVSEVNNLRGLEDRRILNLDGAYLAM